MMMRMFQEKSNMIEKKIAHLASYDQYFPWNRYHYSRSILR